MPRIKERAPGMKHSRAWTTSSPGRPLREPLEPAVFHREYAQPVAAKIRSQHAPAAGVEKQTVRMRRTLQLRIASTTCVLENGGRLAQAAILRHGKDVVNPAPVRRHRENLPVRGEGHVSRTGCGKGKWPSARQRQAALQRINAEGFHQAARQSLVCFDFVGHVEGSLRWGEQNAGGCETRNMLDLSPALALHQEDMNGSFARS